MDNSILSELSWSLEAGALTFKGVRYLLIRPETLAALQKSLEADAGLERAGEIIYAGGFAGGRLSGHKYREALGLSETEAVEFMCRMGGEIGWGRFRLLEADPATRRLVVEVDQSPFAAAYGAGSTSGACHLTRGVLGGLWSGLLGADVVAREVSCLTRGDGCCRFEVKGKS